MRVRPWVRLGQEWDSLGRSVPKEECGFISLWEGEQVTVQGKGLEW